MYCLKKMYCLKQKSLNIILFKILPCFKALHIYFGFGRFWKEGGAQYGSICSQCMSCIFITVFSQTMVSSVWTQLSCAAVKVTLHYANWTLIFMQWSYNINKKKRHTPYTKKSMVRKLENFTRTCKMVKRYGIIIY